jgi:tripartite-type tricarboxylate transporter receptor subunit TctC/ABC-type uncharacterized transport system substrate-binding protein
MKLLRRQFLRLATGAAALPAAALTALGQSYPARPVRIIVAFAAGGGADIIARLIGQWLSERLGQFFLVENRPGGNNNIGTEAAVRAPADGYTLLLATSANAINASLDGRLSFDFIRDTVPVAHIADTSWLSIRSFQPRRCRNSSPTPRPIRASSISARAAPPIYAAGEQFKIATGADLVTVQYPGDAPGLVDLLAGHVDVTIAVLPSAIAYITTGKLRALAVLSATRSPALPDIPVMADFVPGLEASFWFGLVAPKTTPAEITDRLNKEINAALADPMIKARFDNLSATVVPGSPAKFGRFIAADTEKWAKVVKSAGMKSSTRVVGYLSAGSAASDALMLAALRKGLSESGYVEGRNLAIDFRFADGRYDRLPALGEDLVRGRVDVIVAVNGSAALSAKAATGTTPIVFNVDGDPVQLGLVGSLNRPAGNLSGVASFADALASKQLGLLRDIVPKARLIAVLANPDDPFSESNNSSAAAAARWVGQQLFFFKARTEAEIDAAFAGIIQQRADALLVTASPLFRSRASQLIALAATHAAPALYSEREFADAGGLMSYGTNLAEGYSRMGVYAATILNGAKPADLPVQQATKFEFVINLKTVDLVGRKVSLILAVGNTQTALAAKRLTTSIPVVFDIGADPVARGVVPSFNRPGANITGVTMLDGDVLAKRVQLLHYLVPGATRFGALFNPNNNLQFLIDRAEDAVRTFDGTIEILPTKTQHDFEDAFVNLAQRHRGAHRFS